MTQHEQEISFPDDQGTPQFEEGTFDPKKRRTLRVALGAIATGAGVFGAYKGNEFISILIEEKNQAVRDAKKAQLALESQTQDKDTMLLAYKERAYDDTMLVLVESFYPAPLGKALDKVDSNKSLYDPLKRAMLVPEYESRTDAFLRMHQVAKIFIDDYFPQEKDLDKNTLTDVLAYITSKGTLTANPNDILRNGSGLDLVDHAFAMISEGIETVIIPERIRGLPPVTVRPTDLFLERLTLFSVDLRANPHL